jgi:hypothetical protein
MRLSEGLERSFRIATFAAGISSFAVIVVPRAVRFWERTLAEVSVRACRTEGGVALVADDRIVSCAPKVRGSKEAP